jgi:hypothetical protein
MGKIAQTIYGLCDIECIKKFDFGIAKLLAGGTTNTKFVPEQSKVV